MSISLKIATTIWNITPSRYVREKYFLIYCWLVRGKARILTIDDIKLKLDLSQMIDVAVYLKRFELDIVAAIQKHTRSGYTVLDIGANTGMHALPFAARVSPGGKVYAFEPTDYAYTRLQENIALNPQLNVEGIKIALADKNIESHTIDFRSSWRTDRVVENSKSVVAMRMLDDWIEENGIPRVDIIKLDVDGFEYPILKGAVKTLQKFLPIIFIEVGPWHFESEEQNPITILSQMGYRFWDAKTKEETSSSTLRQCFSKLTEEITINLISSASKNFSP